MPLDIDDFDRISRAVPLLADLKPGGRYVATDLYRAGGIPLVAQAAARGRTAARGRADGHRPHDRRGGRGGDRDAGRRRSCVRSRNPLKATGGLVILRGNLAPEGCVVKVAGHERLHHRGPARVFDSEQAALAAVLANQIQPNDVVVIRYEGPAGSPGMPEMLAVTGALVGQGLGDSVALHDRRTLLGRDARVHGGPRGAGSGARRADRRPARGRHRRVRRALAAARRGAARGEELPTRLQAWQPKPPRYASGVMAKYARLVSSAAQGAVTS